MKFNLSDKVVCIDDDFSLYKNINETFQQLPVKGKVYTIREIRKGFDESQGRIGLLLNEIINKPIYLEALFGHFEPAFDSERFVPITAEEIALLEDVSLPIKELITV